MSIEFENAILAGVTLIREAIQSQNYVPGVDGWKIAADGQAEFSDLTIRSSDGSGATVEIENGKAIFTAANGWQIVIDPTNTLPIIYFMDGDGDEAGAINATGDNTRSGLNISSGPFTEGSVTDWRWVTFMGEITSGLGNSWNTLRARDSDPDIYAGGWIFLDGDVAQFGILDTEDPAVQSLLQITQGVALLDESRLIVSARPSAQPAFRVDVSDPGHTGFLLHLQRQGSAKFAVDKDGNVASIGNISATGDLVGNKLNVADTTFTAYTPTVAGGGSATYTSRTGWYSRIGKRVDFTAEITVNAAGSGTGTVTVTAPTSIYRGTRQVFSAHVQGVYVSGLVANGSAVSMDTGSGAVIDRISVSNNSATNRDNIVQGSMLTAGAVITISGSYREA